MLAKVKSGGKRHERENKQPGQIKAHTIQLPEKQRANSSDDSEEPKSLIRGYGHRNSVQKVFRDGIRLLARVSRGIRKCPEPELRKHSGAPEPPTCETERQNESNRKHRDAAGDCFQRSSFGLTFSRNDA